MSNLLDRMAEAMRAFVMDEDGSGDKALALLAEYERVRGRTVVLTFEPLREEEKRGERMLVLSGDSPSPFAGVYITAHLYEGDYAYAELPPLPGPEVFR